MATIQDIGKAIGEAAGSIGGASAQAAARANSISAAAQSAQGQFNQQSADIANELNQNAMSSQWAFNNAQAISANLNTRDMWETAANWNERMWQKQADFNAEQAQISRDWQERMSNTAYQRAMADMQKAGLNPILAYSQGGANVPGGATATVGGAQMSSAQSQMASGGLLGANSASEGNYAGQMENMSTWLALIGAVFNGLSSAQSALGNLGDFGEGLAESVEDILMPEGTARGDLYRGAKNAGNKLWEWFDEKTDQAADWIKEKTGWGTKKK